MNDSLSRLLRYRTSDSISSHGLAIDIGAHHGLFSAELIRSGWFSRVLAYEAHPATFDVLVKNLESFGSTVRLVQKALGDGNGTIQLNFDEDSATASVLQFDAAYSTKGAVKKISIPIVKLDDEHHQFDGENILLIKIDTQGTDSSVIRGAKKTIRRHRPILQVETNFVPFYDGQNSPGDLYVTLRDLGYDFFSAGDIHIDENGRLAFCDGVFVPSEWEIAFGRSYTRIDDMASLETRIAILESICAERLDLIERLHGLLNPK